MILLAEVRTNLIVEKNKLFSYVTNMENYAEWFPGVRRVVSGNDQNHGEVGKTYIETISLPTGNASLTITVKESRFAKTFVTEGDLEPLRPSMRMTFNETLNSNTEFHLSYFSRNDELEQNADLLKTITENLSERATLGIKNLRRRLE